MNLTDLWQLLANIVTVFGLPLAIYTFVLEQRKERGERRRGGLPATVGRLHRLPETVLQHPDLKLRTQAPTPDLTDEQRERMQVLFEILISLFERAYLTAYHADMTLQQNVVGIVGTTSCANGVGVRTFAQRCRNCCMEKTSTSRTTSNRSPIKSVLVSCLTTTCPSRPLQIDYLIDLYQRTGKR